MPNGKSRRSYRGAPVSNTLDGTLAAGANSIALAVAMSGWSTDAEPFFVVVDPGTAKEEKICVKYNSATTLTVVDPASTSTWSPSAAGRGADNTADREHLSGAVIYPVFTALEANQSNELVSKYANAGSVVYQGSGTPGTFTELPIGTSSHVLRVNSGIPQWGEVAEAGIADSAVTSNKIANGAITFAKTAAGVVGLTKVYSNTFSSSSGITQDGIFTSDFTNYRIVIQISAISPAGRYATIRLRSAGTTQSNSIYSWGTLAWYGDTTNGTASDVSVIGAQNNWGYLSANESDTYIDLFSPQVSGVVSSYIGRHCAKYSTFSDRFSMRDLTGNIADTSSFDGIYFYPSLGGTPAGTFTGTIIIYGYNK